MYLIDFKIINVENKIPHVYIARRFRIENKSYLPKTIYIYENGKLISL